MKHTRHFLAIALYSLALAASAQWQWLDKDGRKVFSDRAPSPEIPEKNILKRPAPRVPSGGTEDAPTAAPASAAAASAPQNAGSAPKISGVDKELAERKKKAEEAEAAKRKAEQEKFLKAKVENCSRAKQAKATIDSGMRLARTNAQGEREVLDDAARAAESKRIQSIIDSDCN